MNLYVDGVLTPPADAGSLDGIPAAFPHPPTAAEDGYVVTYSNANGDLELQPGVGGGMTNPMTAVGNLIVGGAVSGGIATPMPLAIGPGGYVLRSVAGNPAWRELSAAGTLAARPTAAAVREGQTYWITDAAAGLELSICLHKGSAAYAWETLAYGVTATGAAVVQAANAAAARSALGVPGTTLGHLWERPAPASVALGSTFISSDDLSEQVSSGVVVSPATITSGWMQRLPSGVGAGRAAISGGAGQARIFADALDLSGYTINKTTLAVLYTWDGTQPLSYGISEVAMIGDRNNNSRGIHIWYVTNGLNTDLCAVTNGIATVLVASANLLANAVGLHALVVAPVTVGPLQYFRFSYDGSVVVDVPIPVLSPYVAPSNSDTIALGSRGDGLVYLNGNAIELAVWSDSTLSNANILALATLPATPTYELPESAATGAAAILVTVSRYDPLTSNTTMPARGVGKPLTVSSFVTKVTL